MIKAAIIGYGNIGRAMVEAVEAAPDFTLCGVVRRSTQGHPLHKALTNVEIVDDVENLSSRPDVALLCTPTRTMREIAEKYLEKGIHTVDSFDIHAQIPMLRGTLDPIAKAHGAVAVVAAGWDPGSDSVVRTILEACAPKGITYTNFGPGMSMGHSVALRAVPGVKDAVSITIPKGSGLHRRMCYVECEEGYDSRLVERKILEDDYFKHDEVHIQFVESVDSVRDKGHGVHIERKGVSGKTHAQRFSFDMLINNPALTSQVMVACARAATRQVPGCYTMIELPPIDLLPGEREEHIARLV